VPLYSQDPDSRGYCRHSPRTYRDEPYDAIKTLCFEVKAVLIDDNSLSVVYERVLCTRLIIKIVPWYCQNISHSLSDPVQASPNQSRGITTVDPYSSAKLEGHTERLGTDTDNQLPEGSIGSYASELCGCGHHALESRDQEPVHANIPAISAATKPSELAAIAEIYAHLAAKYADLARFHDLVEMQATTLGPARAFTMRQKHEPYSQVYFSDNHDFGQSVKPHTGSRRSASRSSMSSLLAKYTANLSLGPRSPVISARNATQENFVGYHSNSAFAALPPAALSLLPSQTFDEYAWTRVSVPLETPDHVDQSKLDTPTKREALPALTITPPALAIPIANAGDEPTPKLCGQGSRKRHATSNMSESSPLKRAKELQKKLHEVNDSNNADTSRTTGPEFESDEEWPLPALAPGIMCDNSFASLVVRDDMTGAFTEQECKNLAIGNKEDGHTMGQLSAVQLKEDAPHHRVDTGYYADLESVAGLPTPAASSVSGSRASSGSVEFCVDADTSARKISRHEQAILWRIFSKAEDSCARNRAEANVEEPRLSADEKKAMEEAIQRSIDEMVPNKAEAKGEESRLSADEKKAMEETMQRSLDEMVGKFDDIFLYTDESGPGLDASTESEEV